MIIQYYIIVKLTSLELETISGVLVNLIQLIWTIHVYVRLGIRTSTKKKKPKRND